MLEYWNGEQEKMFDKKLKYRRKFPLRRTRRKGNMKKKKVGGGGGGGGAGRRQEKVE